MPADTFTNELPRDMVRLVFERNYAELQRAAVRACHDPEMAEDLVQEALLRLMLEIDAGRTPDNVRAWLHRVIANLGVSQGRHAAVGRKFAPTLVSRDEPQTPEAIFMGVELRADLASALGTLPDRARTALVLAAHGYSGTEIARSIGSSGCATRTMMSRARFSLRARVDAPHLALGAA